MANNENDSSTDDKSRDESAEAIRRMKLEESSETDDDETEKEGMRGYKSEHEPGGRVRVARSTRGIDEQSSHEEKSDAADAQKEGSEGTDEQPSGPAVDMSVRGEGEATADEQADEEEEATRGDGAAAEKPEEPAETSGGEQTGGAGEASPAREPEVGMEELTGGSDEGATTEDFAAMFEQQGDAMPQRRTYSSGDRVTGEIVEVGDHYLFVELDPQNTGIVKRREVEDDEGELELGIGDSKEFYVTEVTDDEVYLGQQMSGDQGSYDAIREAYEGGVPVEGKVSGTNKGGFEVKVHGVDAFCPISAIELGFTEEKDIHVGKTYRFRVNEFEDGGDTVVLSRADLLREEQAEKAKEALAKLEEGDVVQGVVTRTTGFGAFVDLGGVEGLCHISELSHRSFDQAGDVVDEGERLEVEILEIETPDGEDFDPTDARISLSRKATETDPWAKVNEEFAVGEQVEGRVIRNAPFGSFVEISPGVEGLVHVSEMSWTEHVKTPDDIVNPGDKVLVQIQDIDIANKRVSLSIREAEGDPWDQVRDDYQVGSVVEGTVENIEDFGVFIQLPTGITALMPRSEMSLPSGATPFRVFNEGEAVEARVMNINEAERKMALTPLSEEDEQASDADSDESEGPTKTPSSSEVSDTGGFGTLGDMIGDQLEGDED